MSMLLEAAASRGNVGPLPYDLHWSCEVGRYLMRRTGEAVNGIPFDGTVQAWYETLLDVVVECVNDLSWSGDVILIPGDTFRASVTAHPDALCVLQCSNRIVPPKRTAIGLVGNVLFPPIDVMVDVNHQRDAMDVSLGLRTAIVRVHDL